MQAIAVNYILLAWIVGRLKADAALETLLGSSGRIFTRVTDDMAEPFIKVGPPSLGPFDDKDSNGFEGSFNILTIDVGESVQKASQIMARIFELFHDVNIEINGFDPIVLKCGLQDLDFLDDNKSIQGTQRFDFILGGKPNV